MAEVYKAHPTSLPNKKLAIKRILPQYAKNRQLVGMLVNEAKVTFGLDHPNVVPVIDFGMIDGTYFIAMEYVYGKDLRTIFLQLKAKKKEFPLPFALYIASCMLKGLDYAHHKTDQFGRGLDIVHRDISPQNIVVSFSGTVKILDFGIALSTAKFDPSELGILKGKFSYMSPEQAYGKELDPRTDIYSAAVVLWELLTMENCFKGSVELELLNQVREPQIPTPTSVNPKIPLELSSIVMKALDRRVHARYPSAGLFAQKIDEYLVSRYGPVSSSDIAAFLRTFFNIDSSELEKDPVLERTRDRKIRGSRREPVSLSDILYEPEVVGPRHVPVDSAAPWTKKRRPIWTWDLLLIPIGIFLIGWIFTSDPVTRFIEVVRKSGPAFFKKHEPAAPAPKPERPYASTLSDQARASLELLDPKTSQSLKDAIVNLEKDPWMKPSKKVAPRSSQRALRIDGKDVIYEVSEKTRSLSIVKIR